MRALWADRHIALITCLKNLNISGAFLSKGDTMSTGQANNDCGVETHV